MKNAAQPLHTPSQLELGDWVMEKYRIDKVLGAGAMGIVYRAVHADLERYVAVKVVRPELLHHPSVVGRMLTEARAAAKLSSEYAVRVLDVGQLPSGYPFIVMEYLDGEDLRTILEREGPFELGRAVDYVLQACLALAQAHQAGIVHRDLKPENLFLAQRSDSAPIIKVFDFGISKEVRRLGSAPSLTEANTLVGSPHYMAPEQMRAADTVDERADIWSLGVLLHELVTKTMPFEGEAFAVICASVLNAPAVSVRAVRPDLPEAFAEIVLRCLEKQKERRFASVLELKRALAPFSDTQYSTESGVRVTVNGRSSAARAYGTSSASALAPPPEQDRPRSRLKRGALVFGVLSLVVGLGYWQLLQETEAPAARQGVDRQETESTEGQRPELARGSGPTRPSQALATPALERAIPDTAELAPKTTKPATTSPRARGHVRRPQNSEPPPATSNNLAQEPAEPAAPNPFDPEEFGGRR